MTPSRPGRKSLVALIGADGTQKVERGGPEGPPSDHAPLEKPKVCGCPIFTVATSDARAITKNMTVTR
jgi:hypothetical protein